MTPDLKQRLLAFADEEIARQSEQSNYLGGNRVVVQDRLVSLPTLAVPVQEEREETWVLALVGQWRRISNYLPPLSSDFIVWGTVPRSTGFFFVNLGFPRTVEESSTTGNFIQYEMDFFTRIYEPSQESIPAPGPASEAFGRPYPGTIRFVMVQRGPGFPGIAYQFDTIEVPPTGTTFLATPAVQNVTLSVSPVLDSFERVR
jgi:hypothetical protein